MKLITIALTAISLCSCSSLGLFKNRFIEAEVGYYKPSSPFDVEAKFGAFLTHPTIINPTK